MQNITKANRRLRVAAIALLCLISFDSQAQSLALADTLGRRYQRFISAFSPEKLFLHIDRTYYSIDETIWFNGWLDNADRQSLLPPSNFIYVEMLDSTGRATLRTKVKRDKDGLFPGNLYIPEDTKTGDYVLRAYTLWQLNGSPEYMFHETVKILGIGALKRPAKDPKSDEVDISFYPEGGRYFAGHRSVMAFKAMNPRGRSVEVTGSLVNSAGDELMAVSTTHDGMGYFVFYPQEGDRYSLKIDGAGIYPVPEPAQEGLTINLGFTSKNIFVNFAGPAQGRFHLFARGDSDIKFMGDILLSGLDRAGKLNNEDFQPGINHLILTDEKGSIISERLFFKYEDPAAVPVCTFATNAQKYAERELIKTVTKITERDGVTPVDGIFSISVVRGAFSTYSQKDDIVSYMKLSSELKGRINEPGYYFDEAVPFKERRSNMDLLMMIQGWRYYDIEKIFSDGKYSSAVKYGKEYFQTVTGRITNPYSEKTPNKFSFTVFAPKLHWVVQENVAESRRFVMDSLDFEDGTGFFIKIDREKGVNNYQPEWDGDNFAPQYVYRDVPGHHYRFDTKPQEEIVPVVLEGSMVDTLQAAVVSARGDFDPYEDNNRGWEKNATDLELYSNQTLMEYIQFKQPSFVYDETEGKMTNTHAEAMTFNADGSSGFGAVKLIVDDTEEEWWMFESIRLEDIEKISISSHPNTFYNAKGGIVSLKFVSGKTLSKMSAKDPTLTYFIPLGYQKPQRFYAPRYDKGDKMDGFDKRNTIFWRPSVSTTDGRAGLFFSNTDQMDYPYVVHVEGRTKDGRWFSWHGKIINK